MYSKKNKWTTANFLVIGYLRNINDVRFDKPTDDTSVTEMFGGEPYLEIKPLSCKFCYSEKLPIYKNKNEYNIRIYVGTLRRDLQLPLDLNKLSNNDKDTKRKYIYNFFSKYLFIIQPSYRITTPIDSIKHVFISGHTHKVHLIRRTDNPIKYKVLSPVPIFNVHNTFPDIKNKKDFIEALKQTHPLGYIHVPWPTNSNDYPDGVAWQEKDGTCSLYTDVTGQSITPYYKTIFDNLSHKYKFDVYLEEVAYGFKNNHPKLVESIYYQKGWLDKQYKYNSIAFIEDTLLSPANDDINDITKYNISNEKNIAQPLKDSSMNGLDTEEISNKLNSEFSDVNNDSSSMRLNQSNSNSIKSISSSTINNVSNVSSKDNNKSTLSNEDKLKSGISGLNSSMDDNINQKQDGNNMSQENNEVSNTNNTRSVEFIHKLMVAAITQDNPEYFKEEDLINLHTAMMSPGLVVLAGLSGTGKSSLINLYAETLGLSGTQCKFIPVRPFWNDDSDLLGYVDTVHSIYQPADCGLVDTLVEADKKENRNKLYIITFDEMNLARVEYYFSQFLSVLEREESKRYIYLYDKNLTNRLYNSNDYPYRIHIGDNVLFCGTINMDESTHKFTDKVLDRSNIINLQLVNFNSDGKVIKHTKELNSDHNIDNLPDTISASYFDSMKDCRKLNDTEKREIKSLLWALHQLLNKANSNLGIGRRIVHQIFMFLENVPKMTNGDNYHLSIRTAFDLQLAQRVFTKLRGSKQDIGRLISLDNDGYVKPDDGTLWEKLANSILSDFTYSKRVLERKGGELENYGFTL